MFKKLFHKIRQFPEWSLVKKVLDLSKRYSFPGFGAIPIYNIIFFIVQEFKRDAISTRANSIAFNFLIAIFPGIIFLFTLIPLLPYADNFNDIITNSLKEALPEQASNYLLEMILGITAIKREGLLSIGFLLSIYFASTGMLTLMSGFDKSYDKVFKRRPWIWKRVVAVSLTLVLGSIFIISIAGIIIGDQVLKLLSTQSDIFSGPLLSLGFRWILALAVIYIGITLIYKYGPSMVRRTSFWSPGGILAATLSIITSIAFAFFVNNFGRYNQIYGSIGALIIIMIWLQLNAYILLIGFELNAAIAVNRNLLEVEEED